MLIAGSIAGLYLVLATAVTLTLVAADNKIFTTIRPTATPDTTAAEADPLEDTDTPTEEIAGEPDPTEAPVEDENFIKPPARTNFLLVALDQERVLTDALMAGCFYRDTCEIKLISIPRDLYTRIPEERLERMRQDGLKPPANGVMKINSLRSYGGGRTFGIQYLQEQLGEMLGVRFDYYVEVEIPAFRKAVNLLGGVDIEVPAGGLYYDDPEQNLHIAIAGGMQHVDGDTAEGLVRFRRYPTGDVGRNAVQMEFMKQLFRQTLRKETIMRDPLAVIDIILNDVRTNIGTDLLKYVPYISKFSSDNISTYNLPGEGSYVNDASFFFPDEAAWPATINEVFYAMPASEPDTPAESVPDMPSKDLRIQVLNGSRTAGRASDFADILTNQGYNVVNTDIYRGTPEDRTRIMVRTADMGEDLLPYFKNAVIKKDAAMSDAYDIVIIIGRSE